MRTQMKLELADAQAMFDAAKNEADANAWAVSIAVVDEGGHPLLLSRLDGCASLYAEVALQKARSAVLAGKPTRAMEESINEGRAAFLSVPSLSATMTGGLPIERSSQLIGGIGASGVKPDQDEQIAQAGLEALPRT